MTGCCSERLPASISANNPATNGERVIGAIGCAGGVGERSGVSTRGPSAESNPRRLEKGVGVRKVVDVTMGLSGEVGLVVSP